MNMFEYDFNMILIWFYIFELDLICFQRPLDLEVKGSASELSFSLALDQTPGPSALLAALAAAQDAPPEVWRSCFYSFQI